MLDQRTTAGADVRERIDQYLRASRLEDDPCPVETGDRTAVELANEIRLNEGGRNPASTSRNAWRAGVSKLWWALVSDAACRSMAAVTCGWACPRRLTP